MGLTNAKLILKNPRKPELQPMEVDALADTGSVFLCIPPHVQGQLELEEREKREVTLADGGTKSQHRARAGNMKNSACRDGCGVSWAL